MFQKQLSKKNVIGLSVLLLFSAVCLGQEDDKKIQPKLTEVWEPVPPVVTPGQGTAPPSDATVLFVVRIFQTG